ncbi:hypothetical protein GCU67_20095 [Modestobacter muralis]|uniref:DUF7402 domain-containing protein n=1 Tax=Modestobacter muralis TaxID=1608614 RepID=A0A6P0EZV3_9ACTN|nr:PIG-L family deacetylase [Modestobacter muralis]NEK96450.1 hypothetical protein [Modestobacter muralis]NEN53350.1 hypothetical protein [Modestobacter muralis]
MRSTSGTQHLPADAGPRVRGTVHRALATVVLGLVALLVGAGVTAPAASAAATGCSVQVVAHPDDDLFFQNPAVQGSITAGSCVTTMYVTSADAGLGATYARSREAGVRAAYATMAGVANTWSTATQSWNGKTVTVSTLTRASRISLVFLRLPDGNLDGSGTTASGGTSLQELLTGTISTLRTVDGPVQSYTWADLVQVIGKLVTASNASAIRTLDFFGDYGDGDHSDHISVARATLQAQRAYAPTVPISSYAGYPGASLAANVSGAALTAKQRAVLAYAPFDSNMCQSLTACNARSEGAWLTRQHLAGELRTTDGTQTGNLASAAMVSTSSQDVKNGMGGSNAVDGVISGYPVDSSAEWSTAGGGAGSWITLGWMEPVQIDRVVLHDRPNTSDRVTGGTLTFSDGSTVTVPALDDAGGAVVVPFPARSVTGVTFTVTSVSASTHNVGLAEMQAWSPGSGPVVAPPAPAADVDHALTASVTASSQNWNDDQTAAKAVDGIADGYPGDHTAEWATQGGGVGSTLTLTWAAPVTLGRVVLHDRPNTSDQVTSATLTFSDGSVVPVPQLIDDGGAVVVNFPVRTTSSLTFTVTGVSATTSNVGLAELEAWSQSSVAAPETETPAVETPATAAPTTTPVPTTTAPATPTTPAAPTTTAPTTTAPAPAAPTTAAPTPAAPTTAAPTPAAPTTAAPTPAAPTTAAPTPAAPTTAAPTTTSPVSTVDLTDSATGTMGLGKMSGVGSWSRWTWTKPVTVGRLVITNRTSWQMNVTSAQLAFSDGSTVAVPAYPAPGKSITVTFPARTTSSLKLTVTGVAGMTVTAGLVDVGAFSS